MTAPRQMFLLLAATLVMASSLQAAERFYLVEYDKLDKSSEYLALTKSELKELKDKVKDRTRYYSRALATAKCIHIDPRTKERLHDRRRVSPGEHLLIWLGSTGAADFEKDRSKIT